MTMNGTKLDRRTTHELEGILNGQLIQLQSLLRASVEENRSTENPSLTDITVHAAETLQTEMQAALMGRRTQQVAQIHDALERLSKGHYGLCQDCQTFIGISRLHALPFAQRCRDCQDRAEQQARRETATAARQISREGEAA